MKYFNSESRFMILCGLKLTLAPVIAVLFTAYIFWLIMSMNYNFLTAYGLFKGDMMKEAYYDYVLMAASDHLLLIFAFFLIVFSVGMYLAHLSLRPFNHLSKQVMLVLEDPERAVESENVLSRFGHLERMTKIFFESIRNKVKPEKVVDIKAPTIDRALLIQYFMIFLILSIVTVAGVFVLSVHIYQRMMDFAINELKNPDDVVRNFFNSDETILLSIQGLSVVSIVIVYNLVAFHIAGRVSGASYSFIRSMREYISGKTHIRVTLRKHDPVQDHAKVFNFYLNQIESETKQEEVVTELDSDLPPPPPLPNKVA